jgi:hypothetical protein
VTSNKKRMEQIKKCTGCKKELPIENFYKNKLSVDGHSIYCVDCTKVNSKKYFQRKKERLQKQENDSLINTVLMTSNLSSDAETLMKVLLIEKMCKGILDEVHTLKGVLTKDVIHVTQESKSEIVE